MNEKNPSQNKYKCEKHELHDEKLKAQVKAQIKSYKLVYYPNLK